MTRREDMETRLSELRADIEPRALSYKDSQISRETLPDVFDLPEMKAIGSPEAARSELSSIFKSYDIRGVVTAYHDAKTGDTVPMNLTEAVAHRIGRALASVVFEDLPGDTKGLVPGDLFVLGRDNGLTSPRIEAGLARGLTEAGVNVIIVGEGCSGEIYGTIQRLGAKGCIMVTRSHVEKEYNGMKIVLGREALHSHYIEQIRDAVFEGRARKAAQKAAVIEGVGPETRSIYMDALVDEFKESLGRGGAPVAVNFGGGTARLYSGAMEEILGQRLVKTFRTESDPDAVAGLPDPTQPRYLETQIAWSKAHPETTLFSFDLDADRVSAMVDGELFLGDTMAFPLAMHKLEVDRPALTAFGERTGRFSDRGRAEEIAGTVLADPRCTKQLSQLVQGLGGKAVQHRIGHSHIKATMNRMMDSLSGACGFESPKELVREARYIMWQAEYSLHFFGTDEHGVPADDALRFMLKFISVMDYYGKVWSEPDLTIKRFLARLLERKLIGNFFQAPEIRTVYDNADKARVVSDVERAFLPLVRENHWELAGMDVLGDGFRVDMPDGFLLFRYSNTSPKLTMRIEAGDKQGWLRYLNLLFKHYNALRKPEYTLDLTENAFLVERFGIQDPDAIL
ncbi:MAG: hypothetical protein HY788_23810 [Deltaproteobacteria bacterium]|nr:hypothetical protein [Deltaproteobacteria bacterium]